MICYSMETFFPLQSQLLKTLPKISQLGKSQPVKKNLLFKIFQLLIYQKNVFLRKNWGLQ